MVWYMAQKETLCLTWVLTYKKVVIIFKGALCALFFSLFLKKQKLFPVASR